MPCYLFFFFYFFFCVLFFSVHDPDSALLQADAGFGYLLSLFFATRENGNKVDEPHAPHMAAGT